MKSRHVNILLLFICIITVSSVYAQTPTENYVKESVFIKKFTSIPVTDSVSSRNTITYYDGLGRPVQTVKQCAGGNSLDLHTLTEYDSYGRLYKTWLPVEIGKSDGSYLSPSSYISSAQTYYADTSPFNETQSEDTPELLDSEFYGAGKAWRESGKHTVIRRGLNNADETSSYCCPRFDVDTEGRLILNGYYEAGRLRYEKVINEDSLITLSFQDFENRKILESRSDGNTYNDTYYVYNKIGQLTYVVTPKGATELFTSDDGLCDTATVRKLCYHYAYDQYNRLIEKRLPGAEPEYYVYDALDNVLMRQDGNLRKENKWYVTKLDHKYRKAVEGIATLEGETRASLQSRWGNDLAIEKVSLSYHDIDKLFYSDTCGISNFEPDVSYFYDNYEHWVALSGQSTVPVDDDYPAGLSNAIGLLTGKAVWDKTIYKQYVISAITYDDRTRVITESSTDYDRMYHHTTHHRYNFAGDLIGKKSVLVNNDLGEIQTSEHSYVYDPAGSLQEVKHSYNGGFWHTLYSCSYDEVKRLSGKTFYPRSATGQSQTLRYGYNIRNQATHINSPVFSQTFRYHDPDTGSEPRWGGSPSAMSFTSVNSNGQFDTCKVNYSYDILDRLVAVTQTTGLESGDTFSESFSYDENGNPLIITRGNINTNPIQYISLTYDGNHITSLNESKSAEGLYPDIPGIIKGDYESGWSYDANGNRTSDPSRDITSITYTTRNQPLKITFSDGSNIEHNYRSDGICIGRTERESVISTVNGGSGTVVTYRGKDIHRIGDFELSSTIPRRVYIDCGYIELDYTKKTHTYNYYIQDNQGSVRAVIDENGTLVQATDYSAYGVPSTRYAGTTDNNRKHLGLEWQSMKGLYGYYNNARFRDAILAGTFYQLDPLAEKYHSFSPYHYGMNNPLRYTDPTGMFNYEWQANVAREIQMLNPSQQVGNITFKKTENRNYQYRFNTTSKVNDGYMVTTHYGVDSKAANNLEQLGDGIMISGFGIASTVVGAEIGFPMMVVGEVISTTGSLIGAGIDLLNSECKNIAVELGFAVADKLVFKKINRLFPGSDLGSRLLKGSTKVKLTVTENVVDEVMTSDKESEMDNNEEDKHSEKAY